MIPPILEIFVLWHPDDDRAEGIALGLLEHFHGGAYAGLVGGAVEVYYRCAPWAKAGGPPRPLPYMTSLPHGLPAATVTAVVPVIGTHLARAVEDDVEWEAYIQSVAAGSQNGRLVGIFPVALDGVTALSDSLLPRLFPQQFLTGRAAGETSALARELAQGIAQLLGDPLGDRLQVFISHTKRASPDEQVDAIDEFVELVRQVIAHTHLSAFFDEADVQPGTDWHTTLKEEASRSGLLVIRSDLYASREWCQREMLLAKRASMPIVTLYALSRGDDRGSFLLDHVPTIPASFGEKDRAVAAIEHALNQLVDEALKRALWEQQAGHLAKYGFHWLPAKAPEPVTIVPWLLENRAAIRGDILVLHPDPPLGPDEQDALSEVCKLAGIGGYPDIMTPRTFASRGGQMSS